MKDVTVKDLMIGNYVLGYYEADCECSYGDCQCDEASAVCEVQALDNLGMMDYSIWVESNDSNTEHYDRFEGILINEKWLLELGFRKCDLHENMYWHKELERVYVHIVSCINIHLGNRGGSIKMVQYVHELQNVFYAVCEKKLKREEKIKEKSKQVQA